MEIQYRIVLTNLATMSVHPEALPSHIEIDEEVIQNSDGVGFGNSGGFSSYPTFGIAELGPSGSRQLSEQWGADATLDPQRLTDLQEIYRVALNFPPLPPPNSIAYCLGDARRDSGTLPLHRDRTVRHKTQTGRTETARPRRYALTARVPSSLQPPPSCYF
jgi:hypothetical protein